ncbi:hypothetical protein Q5P01_013710 [Channa striata]|uniref:Uncharacterized protein n=1 Tax=Channa striata TaxID=64152 RepID=A0AA88SNN7_CHASR|nr:hypothetical protein Q5P01_013710 [Channa striata]
MGLREEDQDHKSAADQELRRARRPAGGREAKQKSSWLQQWSDLFEPENNNRIWVGASGIGSVRAFELNMGATR